MTKYPKYNIIIHGNPKYRRAVFPFEDARGPAAKAYEERIRVTLNAISRTTVGRALFMSLCARVPVYVVPSSDPKNPVTTRTGQLTSNLMDGVRVMYSPETWAIDPVTRRWFPGYLPDESLFHEMVHASRTTNFGFAGWRKEPLQDMQDPEEFLAVMLTNVLRSEKGAKKFSRDYTSGALVSQADLELLLAVSWDYLNVLESFLHDPLVRQVVPLKMSLNPFRDLKQLKGRNLAVAGRP